MAPDSLTCGVCRKEFPLGEIVRFIQHKVLSCNKENYRVMCARSGRGGGGGPDGDDLSLQIDGGGSSGNTASAATGSVCLRRPSISAPINSRRLTATVSSSSTLTSATGAGEDEPNEAGAGQSDPCCSVKAEEEEDRTGAHKGPATADAGSNTVNSEALKLDGGKGLSEGRNSMNITKSKSNAKASTA
ncbi:hypothetical protein OUZ56_003111 [Daphnia magna]|uniref:BCL-11A-like CCHC zinc finger domain-containing protein n=1 Tax=Daphnia magna TaxID=35525 RepID=A0ABR0A7T0_9CRUS|nr:hypothetical protein OUZ56_003111 [Daphnia magna]